LQWKNKVYIKRNFLNLTIRLKIITSRLLLPTLTEREKEREEKACSRATAAATVLRGKSFTVCWPRAPKRVTLLQLFNGIFLFVTCFCNTRETEWERKTLRFNPIKNYQKPLPRGFPGKQFKLRLHNRLIVPCLRLDCLGDGALVMISCTHCNNIVYV